MNRKTTFLSFKFLFTLLCMHSAGAQQIYTNGSLSTGASSKSGVAAPTGYTWSECQNDTGSTTESNGTAGFGALYTNAGTNNLQLADDFIVPAGQIWNVASFDFYGYKTGYTGTTIPIDQLRIEIYNVDPSTTGATPIFGNMTTNRLDAGNSGDSNMYRIFNSMVPTTVNVPGTTRKIWRYRGNLAATLPAGTYWVVYQLHDALEAGGFLPPVTILGSRGSATANGKQNTIASTTVGAVLGWANLVDGGSPAAAADVPQDMPFLINGTVTLGINENDFASRVMVYPNPVKNIISLSSISDALINSVEVVDVNGRTIKNVAADSVTQINVSDLSSGIYFLKIGSDKGTATKKIIKE